MALLTWRTSGRSVSGCLAFWVLVAMTTDAGASSGGDGLCPKGYMAISQNLDGVGKAWAQPHPLATRTKAECAAICNARSGCTAFEFAEGATAHGACGTYTGGDANIQGDEKRLKANSNWRSCVRKPSGDGLCPKGYKAISQNLDGVGKAWAQPHPLATRTKTECAAICNARSGCTAFEFAEGATAHGACGTYTGGDSNVQGDEKRLEVNSNWRSCVRKPKRCPYHDTQIYTPVCHLKKKRCNDSTKSTRSLMKKYCAKTCRCH